MVNGRARLLAMLADEEVGRPHPLIPGVRSIRSQATCFVNFKNCTNSDVDVIWIKYDGTPQVYGTLPPSGNLKLKTYETHPWIFRDNSTLEKFQVNSQDIFRPTSFRTIQTNSIHPVVGPVSPGFVLHPIHYPLYNLKERASQVILQRLTDPKRAYDLEIPLTLKAFLAQTKFKH